MSSTKHECVDIRWQAHPNGDNTVSSSWLCAYCKRSFVPADAVEQAREQGRREGFEQGAVWMRERAAEACDQSARGSLALKYKADAYNDWVASLNNAAAASECRMLADAIRSLPTQPSEDSDE